MNDSEKPFACTTEGCNMSFVNEDHLTVHKKKHDMMLNLGINNKSNLFIADQTPTPTRFIRNCEEVGLFQDLQHENPFDETFRRAVEAGKIGVLIASEIDHNDDLHTPNVFPHIMEESITAISSRNEVTRSETLKVSEDLNTPNILPHIEEASHRTSSTTVSAMNHQVTKLVTKSFTESSTIIQTVTSEEITLEDEMKISKESSINIGNESKENTAIHTISDSSSDNSCATKSETNLPIGGAEMQLLLKTQDGKVLRFLAAPIIETHVDSSNPHDKEDCTGKVKAKANDCDKSASKIIQSQKLSAAKLKLKQALTKNGAVPETKIIRNNQYENRNIKSSNEQSNSNTRNPKKQAILERNRASSMRSRAKRKAWIQELQHSLKMSNETNANLQDQVKSLQAQVAKLKTLLLAHKECPVTKAMETGNGVVVGSKVLTIKPNEMKQVAVITGSAKPTKRPSTEKPIVPKKKPVIVSALKNPIILPKSHAAANTITLHGTESIKSIPTISIVTPYVANAQSGNAILKIPIITDAVSLSSTINQNAASKTTGT
ncbi:cyclic AMP-dependent transcription factor ATF-2 [Nasonia vitripennis]|uniref:Cyclic AMP-dependent transcription factor ATF-2 n=1 Tax=Nasonia vitripennis TaxID=7425 RepID=A0A7M7IRQ0_NASVI|nr:cyclic AMP-dependent transcription factor ATF-2 [Nasonia vitripennis]